MSTDEPRALRRPLPALGVIVGAFVVAGVVAGIGWSVLATGDDPVRMWMSTDGPVVVDEAQAGRLFAMDGWFAALGGIAGVVLGTTLYACLRRHGPWTVVGLVVGALVGAGVMLGVGTMLANDSVVLAWEPRAEPGSTLSAPLSLHAYGVLLVWPIAALVPVLVLAWLWTPSERGVAGHPVDRPQP